VTLDHCKRSTSIENIAKSHGVPQSALYRWEKDLLSMESIKSMRNQRNCNKPVGIVCSDEKLKLEKEVKKLKQEFFDLKLECDILKKTSKVLKSDKHQS
jgi:transposase-like protein